MPTFTEIADNAKKIKEQIAAQAGVAPKDINDKNLAEVGKALEGSKVAVANGVAPTEVSIDKLKAAAAPGEKDKSNDEELTKQQKIAYAIAAIAPTLIGSVFGGNRGGAIGANVSQNALNQMDTDFRNNKASEKADRDKKAMLASESAKDADKERVRVSERAEDKGLERDKLKLEKYKIDQQMRMLQQKGADKLSAAGIKLTKGEEALDKKFGGELAEFVAGGGYADVQKNLNQLKEVAAQLNDPKGSNVSGPLVGRLPFRDVWNPDSVNLEESVAEVVQRNLRLVLGAQFTEKEGAALIKRAYNPRLDEKTNATRVNNLVSQIQKAAEAKLAAAQYFEENGTLKGYNGTANVTFDDIASGIEGKQTAKSSGTPLLPAAQAGQEPNFDEMDEKDLLKYLGE